MATERGPSVSSSWIPALDWIELSIIALTIGCFLTVFTFEPDTYTLAAGYTDHLRHSYSAWASLQIGVDVMRTPIAEWQVVARHPHVTWTDRPHLYPAGSLLVFLPFGLLSNLGILADPRVHQLAVLAFVTAGGVVSLQLKRLSERQLAWYLGLPVVLTGVFLFLWWGWNGFYDSLVAGAGLYGIDQYRRDKPKRALLGLVGALSMHYRIWYLGPLAVGAAIDVSRQHETLLDWRTATSGVLGALGLLSVVVSWSSLSGLSVPDSAGTNPLAVQSLAAVGGFQLLVALCGLSLVVAAVASESRPVAASLGLAVLMLLSLPQWQLWYPALFVPAMVLPTGQRPQLLAVSGFLLVCIELRAFDVLLVHV